jgi:hypothetical protein
MEARDEEVRLARRKAADAELNYESLRDEFELQKGKVLGLQTKREERTKKMEELEMKGQESQLDARKAQVISDIYIYRLRVQQLADPCTDFCLVTFHTRILRIELAQAITEGGTAAGGGGSQVMRMGDIQYMKDQSM